VSATNSAKVVLLLAFACCAITAPACDEPAPPGECVVGCPQGERYPCPCTAGEICGDGSTCGTVDVDYDLGICSLPCEDHSDCALDWDCTGEGRCVLELEGGDGRKHCALTCRGDGDCPFYMECLNEGGLDLCYPVMD